MFGALLNTADRYKNTWVTHIIAQAKSLNINLRDLYVETPWSKGRWKRVVRDAVLARGEREARDRVMNKTGLRLYDPAADGLKGRPNPILLDNNNTQEIEGAVVLIRMLCGEYMVNETLLRKRLSKSDTCIFCMVARGTTTSESVLHTWWECSVRSPKFLAKLEKAENLAGELIEYSSLNVRHKFLVLTQPDSMYLPTWARLSRGSAGASSILKQVKYAARALHWGRVQEGNRLLKQFNDLTGSEEKFLRIGMAETLTGAAAEAVADEAVRPARRQNIVRQNIEVRFFLVQYGGTGFEKVESTQFWKESMNQSIQRSTLKTDRYHSQSEDGLQLPKLLRRQLAVGAVTATPPQAATHSSHTNANITTFIICFLIRITQHFRSKKKMATVGPPGSFWGDCKGLLEGHGKPDWEGIKFGEDVILKGGKNKEVVTGDKFQSFEVSLAIGAARALYLRLEQGKAANMENNNQAEKEIAFAYSNNRAYKGKVQMINLRLGNGAFFEVTAAKLTNFLTARSALDEMERADFIVNRKDIVGDARKTGFGTSKKIMLFPVNVISGRLYIHRKKNEDHLVTAISLQKTRFQVLRALVKLFNVQEVGMLQPESEVQTLCELGGGNKAAQARCDGCDDGLSFHSMPMVNLKEPANLSNVLAEENFWWPRDTKWVPKDGHYLWDELWSKYLKVARLGKLEKHKFSAAEEIKHKEDYWVTNHYVGEGFKRRCRHGKEMVVARELGTICVLEKCKCPEPLSKEDEDEATARIDEKIEKKREEGQHNEKIKQGWTKMRSYLLIQEARGRLLSHTEGFVSCFGCHFRESVSRMFVCDRHLKLINAEQLFLTWELVFAKMEQESGICPLNEDTMKKVLTDECYERLRLGTRGDKAILQNIEKEYMTHKTHGRELAVIRSCNRCQWRLRFPLPDLTHQECRACFEHCYMFRNRERNESQLRGEIVRKMQQWMERRHNMFGLRDAERHTKIGFVLLTPDALLKLDENEKANIVPVKDGREFERIVSGFAGRNVKEATLFVQPSRTDTNFMWFMEELVASRMDTERERQVKGVTNGELPESLEISAESWYNHVNVPWYARRKIECVDDLASPFYNAERIRAHKCEGRSCSCLKEVGMGDCLESNDRRWTGGVTLMDLYAIRKNAEMAKNTMDGQEETVLEVFPGTHIRVSNALLNPANPLINPDLERHPSDCPANSSYACPPANKRQKMGERISSSRPGHVEFGVPGESLAPAAASEFVTEGFPKYQNRPENFTLEEFHTCLDQMDAKDQRIKALKQTNDMLDKEVGVLLKVNLEMRKEAKTAEAKIELATDLLTKEVAKNRKRKFGPEDVGRECFTQREGGIRIMSVDQCDALTKEMSDLKLKREDLEKQKKQLENDLKIVKRKNQQVLQVVFKPMPFVTAKDTSILRKARAEFVSTHAIGHWSGLEQTVWADGAMRTWQEAEAMDQERRGQEIDAMASGRTVYGDDTVWDFENAEKTTQASRIAKGDDTYG